MRFLPSSLCFVAYLVGCLCSANESPTAGKAVSVAGRVLVRNEDGNSKKLSFLKPGDSVNAGAVINTSSVANVKLLMTDKTVLDLGPSTLFKVDEYDMKNGDDRNVNMTMGYGKLRAAVNLPVGKKGKFTIRTKTATMGVRGTEFVILSDLGSFVTPTAPAKQAAAREAAPSAGKTQITVIQGTVEVTTKPKPTEKKAEPIKLTEGTQLTTAAPPATKAEEAEAARVPSTPAEVKQQEIKVVKLTVEEIKAVKQEIKQEDKTFVQAVVVDTSVNKGAGGATLQAFSASFTLPTDFVPSIENMGLPGTFGAGLGMQSAPRDNIGAPVKIRVEFK